MNKRHILLALAAIALASCGGDGGSSSALSTPESTPVSTPTESNSDSGSPSVDSTPSTTPGSEQEVTLTADATNVELSVGESKNISLTVTPENTQIEMTYDTGFIEAKLDGKTLSVKGIAAGQSSIVLKAGEAQLTIAVTVKAAAILPTAITTDFNRKIIGIGEEVQVNATFAPENTSEKTLRYISSNPSVASISPTGLIRGIAKGEAVITISSVSAPDIVPITISLSVSDDENTVNNDKVTASLGGALEKEGTDVVSGQIELVSKLRNDSEPSTFKNDYQIYNDVVYNDITDYDATTRFDFYGLYEGKVYYQSQRGPDILAQKAYGIDDSGFFSSDLTTEEAYDRTHLPAIRPYTYSSSDSFGVGDYVQNLIEYTFLGTHSSETKVVSDNGTLTLSRSESTIAYVSYYELTLAFANGTFKTVEYSFSEYSVDSLDEDGNLLPDSTRTAYDDFTATLTTGVKTADTEPKVNPANFFYSDFDAKFYLTSQTVDQAKTTFNVKDNIIFKIVNPTPATASSIFDRIEITAVSDPTVIDIGANKTSMFALAPGQCTVTLSSANVDKQFTLTVVEPPLESLAFSSGLPDSLGSNETATFLVELTPAGAKDDIKVELGEGDDAYATLGMTDYGYYYLSGNPSMAEKSAVVTVTAYSESHPEVKVSKEVTIVKQLTDREIVDILTAKTYVSEVNTSYYNYSASFTLVEEGRTGTIVINNPSGGIFETCYFTWIISNGTLTIASQTYLNDYFSSLSIDLTSADLSSFEVSFMDEIETDDEYGSYIDFVFLGATNE